MINSIVYLRRVLVVQMWKLWLEESIALWGYFESDGSQIKVPYKYMSSHVKH